MNTALAKNPREFFFLFVCNSPNLGAMQKIAEEVPGQHGFVSSVQDLYRQEVASGLYRGFILDVETAQRLSKKDKETLERIKESFPMLFVDTQTLYAKKDNPEIFWKHAAVCRFMQACNRFTPRPLRLDDRVIAPLQALLTPECGSPNSSLRAVTANISPNGAFFVAFEQDPQWACGMTLWARFLDLDDQSFIRTEIRWVARWGAPLQFPGYGVLFREIKDAQREQIAEILSLARQQSFCQALRIEKDGEETC